MSTNALMRHLLHGLVIAAAWHRTMLHNSAGYRRFCHALAVYLTTGYWDLRPPEADPQY